MAAAPRLPTPQPPLPVRWQPVDWIPTTSTSQRCRHVWTSRSCRTSTCSFGRRASNVRRTSCSGRARTPNSSSSTPSGRTSTAGTCGGPASGTPPAIDAMAGPCPTRPPSRARQRTLGPDMGHQHTHVPTSGATHQWRLVLALCLSLTVLVVEVIGGLVIGSLALLADAGHVLTDVAGLGLALAAIRFAQRPPTARRTFGHLRLEILAAAVNAVVLSIVGVWVIVEAVRRWSDPPDVNGWPIVAVASLGLVANAIALVVLRAGARESLNVKGAYLEVFGDLVGSAAVVVAGLIIALTGWVRVDAIAAILVGLVVLPRAYLLFRETADVLMLSTPKDVALDDVREHILEVPGVIDVHDLHAWTITSGVRVLSAHVVVEPSALGGGG